jgi:hypothetical protein
MTTYAKNAIEGVLIELVEGKCSTVSSVIRFGASRRRQVPAHDTIFRTICAICMSSNARQAKRDSSHVHIYIRLLGRVARDL